jgi:succinate dehydrogenase/fumarate reductase flavoprotein subunit
MTTVALLVARSALARRESRGAHHRSDHPARDDRRYGQSSCIALDMEEAAIDAGAVERLMAARLPSGG